MLNHFYTKNNHFWSFFKLRVKFKRFTEHSTYSIRVYSAIDYSFSIRYRYNKELRILVSNFVDIKSIDANKLKWENLENEAKKQFPHVHFNLRFLYIFFIFILFMLIRFKEKQLVSNFNNIKAWVVLKRFKTN